MKVRPLSVHTGCSVRPARMKHAFTRAARVVITIAVLAASVPAGAATVYVDSRASSCGDGRSWATAFKYLQDALTFVSNNGASYEIWVAAGTYRPDRNCAFPDGTLNRDATFLLSNIGALRGGFAGNEDPGTFDLSARDFTANQTILSGDLAGDDGPNFANNGENCYHVVTAIGVPSTTLLDGFTVSGGNAGGSGSSACGGGIFISAGKPQLRHCIFSGNYARTGGGIYNTGNPTLIQCEFVKNRAFNATGSSGVGGGLYNLGSIQLTECTFRENNSYNGGGVYNCTYMNLHKCVFTGNSVDPNGSGGGLNASGSSRLALEGCIFRANYGGYSGGAMSLCNVMNLSLLNCEFHGNRARAGGAILFGYGNNVIINNCSFSENRGYYGGAIDNIGGTNIVLSHCSFANNGFNHHSTKGGGIFAELNSSTTLNNCIFWGNHIEQLRQKEGMMAVTYSCVQGGWPGVGNIDVDPRFVSAAAGDLRLGAGSPCIDAGNNALVPADMVTDLLGFTRFFDDPNVDDCRWLPDTCGTAPIVDMGAYESSGIYPPMIIQQPVGQILCEGETASFSVVATGTGVLTYRWQKDGVDLVEDGRFVGVSSSTLWVNVATLAENADYRCVIANADGSTVSGEVALVVRRSTVITQQPANMVGTPATFTVAAIGDDTLTYRWQKNGINLTDDIHYKGTTTPALTIAYCACGDSAAYRCVVTGGCTVAVSESATLTCRPGDFDDDTDVDQEDFGALQTCLAANLITKPSCQSMDLDASGVVDNSDAAKFIACLSGAQVPSDPNCGN